MNWFKAAIALVHLVHAISRTFIELQGYDKPRAYLSIPFVYETAYAIELNTVAICCIETIFQHESSSSRARTVLCSKRIPTAVCVITRTHT